MKKQLEVKYEVGQSVWWTDPDHNEDSGWYEVKAINVGKGIDMGMVFISNEYISDMEAYLHELSDEAPDPIALALDFANDAYEAGELRLNEQLPMGERGDGLADFIVNELNDVLKDGETDPQVIQETIRNSLELAVRKLKDVIEHTCDNPDFEQLLLDRANQPQRPNSYDSIKVSEPVAGM